MGQKHSCFKNFDCLQMIGRGRDRPKPSEIQAVDSSVYCSKNGIPDWTSLPISEGFASYFHLNSETAKRTTGYDAARDAGVPSTPTPDFEIKDGTLILTPSKTDISLPSNFTCLSSGALFGAENVVHSQDLKETPQPINEDNYHHSLPYIPPKPTLPPLEEFNDKEQQSDDAKEASPPAIPPRKFEKIIKNVAMKFQEGSLDSSPPNEGDSQSNENPLANDKKDFLKFI